jgi:hypothetical protein
MAVEPKYQLENKYSYMVGTFRRASTSVYEEASQESSFEDKVQSLFMEALGRIQQIQQGLNFFGFGPDYVPPFGFEYLQNTARYFAQQASQIEQRFIQFQSQAENAELQQPNGSASRSRPAVGRS